MTVIIIDKHKFWLESHFFFPFEAELESGMSVDLSSGYVFYVFDIFRSKSIKIDRLITEIDKIDDQKNSTDRFPSIFDINR